jgi:hypothetical protein
MPRKATISGGNNNTYNLLFFVIIILLGYILYTISNNNKNVILFPQQLQLPSLGKTESTCNDKFNNICNPPLKKNEYINEMVDTKKKHTNDLVPINIQTRGTNSEYQQVGILTQNKPGTKDNLILPLMGRRNLTGRDKWQYYSMSNTGHMNSKLPISINGKSCTSEYGCDPIYNGDMIYVEGYNDLFKVTKYENDTLRYLPSI